MGAIHKLTVTQVQSFKKAGLYSDGGCLCFQITVAGVKSWVFRYMHIGKPRMMGLGPLGTVSLSKARELAADYRAIKNSGRDPIEYRDSLAQLKNAKEKKIKTFEECAVTYIDIHKLGWKNKKHIQQWSNTLSTYAFPIIGHLDVNLVGDAEIRAILDPIWHNKTETATRIRSRLERIIDWSRVQGYREGENPARWRGHQEFNFPIATKLKHIKHHPALPFETTPQFYKELLYNNHLGAKALQLIILTASRIIEVRFATWTEFNFEKNTWTVPADRMKGGVEHIVPLSEAALTLIKSLPNEGDALLFPGTKFKRPVSDNSITNVVKSIAKNVGHSGITTHGFRSTFRDWAGEITNFERETVEFCIAHKIKDKTEAAYARGNQLEKRRTIMTAWANYCIGNASSNNVISLLR